MYLGLTLRRVGCHNAANEDPGEGKEKAPEPPEARVVAVAHFVATQARHDEARKNAKEIQ